MTGNSATTNGGAIYLGTSTTANVLNMSFSRIVGNTSPSFNGLLTTGGTANVENNWWGCNTGPSAAPCDTAGAAAPGVVDFNPWLRFTHTASPSTIVVGQSTTLTASFLTNSANQPIAASNLDVLIGLPIIFNNAARGTISGAQATIQANGTATATFTGTSAGAGSADAKVDNGTATANITINKANTTVMINSNTPNPSNVNTAVTVTFSVAVTSPGAGTPTGTVTVSDGVNSCMASVAAGSCMITLTTRGTRTLTATYSNDANFNASTSSGVSQTVLAPTAASVEVSGRVMTNSGRGISSARVTITDQLGNSRSATTSAFGYFRFADVQAGETYVILVVSKRYQFAPQVLNITEDLTDLTFVALQ